MEKTKKWRVKKSPLFEVCRSRAINNYSFFLDLNEVPTKCISFTGVITVEAQIQFIDFEGRSDGESIQKIISNMKPRRLILIRGSEENTQAMFSYAQQYTDAKIYCPKVGELIDVTMETHIYQVDFFLGSYSRISVKHRNDILYVNSIFRFV